MPWLAKLILVIALRSGWSLFHQTWNPYICQVSIIFNRNMIFFLKKKKKKSIDWYTIELYMNFS